MRFITAFVLAGIFTVLTILPSLNQTPFPRNRVRFSHRTAFNPVSASPVQKAIMTAAPI